MATLQSQHRFGALKMDNMNITGSQYMSNDEGANVSIKAIIDGQEMFVPMDPRNRHYKEILRQTAAKTLVIKEAQ